MNLNDKVLLPKDLPKHHAVGRVFYGWEGQVYFCDSYDPRCDYWMTNVLDEADRKAVSPRAINATFHSAWDSWKPTADEVSGLDIEFHMVDLRVPPEEFKSVVMVDKDCLSLDDRQILFFWPEDAKKFLNKVKAAMAKRAAAGTAKGCAVHAV